MSPPTAKPRTAKTAIASTDEIASVRIELVGSEPLIWRQVEVPTSITLNHGEIAEWLEGYDPHGLDDLLIKYALNRIAARRRAARSRAQKHPAP